MSLVIPRWIAIAGQTAAIFAVNFGLQYEFPFLLCLGVVGASANLNLIATLRSPANKKLSDREATGYLAFDILQLTVLLYLTGGLQNPFFILFLAPVTISASSLSLRSTILLMSLAFACVSFVGVFHLPFPWKPGESFALPILYQIGLWTAIGLGLSFSAIYAWRIAQEARRMSDALAALQYVVGREQRLSAVGGLAAAAAHELGTPLGTIALIAKELGEEMGDHETIGEDVQLLISQVNRCRDILGRLSADPHLGDIVYDQLDLGSLLHEVVEAAPVSEIDIEIQLLPHLRFFDGDELLDEPRVQRRPEIIYGLSNFVNNAVDFAQTSVVITADWDEASVRITIEDDGPGFAPRILDQLGEPYLTTRRRVAKTAKGHDHEGLGLGVFIAKTLIERTGGQVKFKNRSMPEIGAMVEVVWPDGLETP